MALIRESLEKRGACTMLYLPSDHEWRSMCEALLKVWPLTAIDTEYDYQTTSAYRDNPQGATEPHGKGWEIVFAWSTPVHFYYFWRRPVTRNELTAKGAARGAVERRAA